MGEISSPLFTGSTGGMTESSHSDMGFRRPAADERHPGFRGHATDDGHGGSPGHSSRGSHSGSYDD